MTTEKIRRSSDLHIPPGGQLHLLQIWEGWPPRGAAGALHPRTKHYHRQGQKLRICRML
jgi:hypothetical protein